MENLIKLCGPEIVAIMEAVATMAGKIKASIETVTDSEPAFAGMHLPKALLIAIRDAAESNRPFTCSGQLTGLYGRRGELPAAFHKLSRSRIDAMAKQLLDHGEIIKCTAGGSTAKRWLDVPTGRYGCGFGETVTVGDILKKRGAA